jgi:hypothetical protein
VDAERAIAVRSRYLARPGRRAIVVIDLADLRGPTEGAVELPLRLFWYPDRIFDLCNRDARREMYETVLREASRPEDLTSHLHSGTLVDVWPTLTLPKGVRQAWEEQHPKLRDATVSAA